MAVCQRPATAAFYDGSMTPRTLRTTFASFLVVLLPACASMPTTAAGHNSVLLISLDGFRADYLDLGITPKLSRLADDGVRAEWMTPSYPSLTFPNHYTLVTGLRPDRHGIVHNTMRDASLGTFALSRCDAVGDRVSAADPVDRHPGRGQ